MRTQRKRKRRSAIPAEVQTLEPKLLLSAGSVDLTDAGQLVVQGTNRGDRIDVVQDGDLVNVTLNGRQSQFAIADINQVIVLAGNGADTITLNGADIPSAVLDGGNGNDNVLVVASNADNVLIGGRGNDLVSTTGLGSDSAFGGPGRDTIYTIVGAPNVNDGGSGPDRQIIRDGVDGNDAGRRDTLIAFRPGEAPGTLRDGVLYLGVGTGGNISVFQMRGMIVANINGQLFSYRASDVDAVAGIGSGGDDTFLNFSRVDSVFYGAGGDDVLIGGRGDDVLKGGGGDDLIIGRGGDDFLTGDAGRDVVFGSRRGFVLRDLDDLFIAGVF